MKCLLRSPLPALLQPAANFPHARCDRVRGGRGAQPVQLVARSLASLLQCIALPGRRGSGLATTIDQAQGTNTAQCSPATFSRRV